MKTNVNEYKGICAGEKKKKNHMILLISLSVLRHIPFNVSWLIFPRM